MCSRALLLAIGIALLVASPAHAETSIEAGPPPHSASRAATFFSGSGDRFECSILGDRVPCASPWTVDVPEGRHLFQVRSADDDRPATYEWTVDLTPPELWVAATREDTPGIFTVVLAATEAVTGLRCTWDAGPAFDCGGAIRGPDIGYSEPFDVVAATYGFHTLTFEGTDNAGLSSARRSYSIYALGPSGPPAVAVMAPPPTPPPPPPATSAREVAVSVAAALNADAAPRVQYEAPRKGKSTVVVRTATGRRVVVWRGTRALMTREVGDVPLALTAAGERLLALGQPVRLRVEVTYRVGRRVWSRASRTVIVRHHV